MWSEGVNGAFDLLLRGACHSAGRFHYARSLVGARRRRRPRRILVKKDELTLEGIKQVPALPSGAGDRLPADRSAFVATGPAGFGRGLCLKHLAPD